MIRGAVGASGLATVRRRIGTQRSAAAVRETRPKSLARSRYASRANTRLGVERKVILSACREARRLLGDGQVGSRALAAASVVDRREKAPRALFLSGTQSVIWRFCARPLGFFMCGAAKCVRHLLSDLIHLSGVPMTPGKALRGATPARTAHPAAPRHMSDEPRKRMACGGVAQLRQSVAFASAHKMCLCFYMHGLVSNTRVLDCL